MIFDDGLHVRRDDGGMLLSVKLHPVINDMRPSMAIHNTHQQN